MLILCAPLWCLWVYWSVCVFVLQWRWVWQLCVWWTTSTSTVQCREGEWTLHFVMLWFPDISLNWLFLSGSGLDSSHSWCCVVALWTVLDFHISTFVITSFNALLFCKEVKTECFCVYYFSAVLLFENWLMGRENDEKYDSTFLLCGAQLKVVYECHVFHFAKRKSEVKASDSFLKSKPV